MVNEFIGKLEFHLNLILFFSETKLQSLIVFFNLYSLNAEEYYESNSINTVNKILFLKSLD